MITELVNLISQTMNSTKTTAIQRVAPKSANPFENPFVSSSSSYTTNNQYYGKNQPVKGGYFAGYYNGKPNIVGRKLFIEV